MISIISGVAPRPSALGYEREAKRNGDGPGPLYYLGGGLTSANEMVKVIEPVECLNTLPALTKGILS